eukprot:6621519-Pyramimonas_sp.AAC.1
MPALRLRLCYRGGLCAAQAARPRGRGGIPQAGPVPDGGGRLQARNCPGEEAHGAEFCSLPAVLSPGQQKQPLLGRRGGAPMRGSL